MAAGQALFQGQLAFALDVAVGRVKVVEPLRQKGIDHLLGLFNVDVLALHRQAHKAKAKIFLIFSISASPLVSPPTSVRCFFMIA